MVRPSASTVGSDPCVKPLGHDLTRDPQIGARSGIDPTGERGGGRWRKEKAGPTFTIRKLD